MIDEKGEKFNDNEEKGHFYLALFRRFFTGGKKGVKAGPEQEREKMEIIKNIKEIERISTAAIQEGVFPGVGIGIAVGEKGARQRREIALGSTRYEAGRAINGQTLFDLASLTKPLATTLLVLTLRHNGAIQLADPLTRFFDGVPADKAGITTRDLLGHSSGLSAHQPYYQRLTESPLAARKERLFQMIMAEPLQYPTGSQTLYSDLGFILLGLVVEKVAGQPLDELFREEIAQPLGLAETIFFNRNGSIHAGEYAATEFCPWRGRVIAGEVSDENCFALGGVAGHAGLFGSTGAVLTLVEAIHDVWQGDPSPLAIDPAEMRHFLTRQPIPGSTWALGFDTPAASGSTSGHFFSPTSVGHLGFTGTSFWIDPLQHAMVVLLTNRVHPSRENNQIKAFRPALHDAVMQGLGLGAQ